MPDPMHSIIGGVGAMLSQLEKAVEALHQHHEDTEKHIKTYGKLPAERSAGRVYACEDPTCETRLEALRELTLKAGELQTMIDARDYKLRLIGEIMDTLMQCHRLTRFALTCGCAKHCKKLSAPAGGRLGTGSHQEGLRWPAGSKSV